MFFTSLAWLNSFIFNKLSPFRASSKFLVLVPSGLIVGVIEDAACPATLLSSYKRKIISFLIPCLQCCQVGGFQKWVSIYCSFPEVVHLGVEMLLRIPCQWRAPVLCDFDSSSPSLPVKRLPGPVIHQLLPPLKIHSLLPCTGFYYFPF